MRKNKIDVPELAEFYQLENSDYSRAIEMLGAAFKTDPIWTEILKEEPEKFPLAFGVPMKYCLKYGQIYAPTSDLNGLAAWVGSPYIQANFWRMLRSGSMPIAMQLGADIGKKISQIFDIIEKDRKNLMQTPFLYLYVLGVHPTHQGQGLGKNLVKTMLDHLPPKIPVYLETESERNVSFYERLGFEVVKEISVPILDLPMWEMIYSNS